MEKILKYYDTTKDKINIFLEINRNNHLYKERVFFELMFCISVPQTKAPATREAVKKMYDSGILFNGTEQQILQGLNSVRFNEAKSKRIVEARNNFDKIYQKINETKQNPFELRLWLIENIKGIGWKEASHLLRNIGLGEDLAMFDIHILRTMHELGLINDDNSVTGKKYLEYEKIFQELARNNNIKPAQMDIAIWLMRSGNNDIM